MQTKIIPIKKDWRNSLIRFIQWLMAAVFLFAVFSCGNKEKAKSPDYGTYFIGDSTVTEDGMGRHQWMALCIKEARTLPNAIIICDSGSNVIRIFKDKSIKNIVDSILAVRFGSGMPN